MIVSGIGVVDATPSGGDTMNTSSTDRAKKRSGPIDKIKKSYKRTLSSNELTGDLIPNKVETGSAKVNLYTFIISLVNLCECICVYLDKKITSRLCF